MPGRKKQFGIEQRIPPAYVAALLERTGGRLSPILARRVNWFVRKWYESVKDRDKALASLQRKQKAFEEYRPVERELHA